MHLYENALFICFGSDSEKFLFKCRKFRQRQKSSLSEHISTNLRNSYFKHLKKSGNYFHSSQADDLLQVNPLVKFAREKKILRKIERNGKSSKSEEEFSILT